MKFKVEVDLEDLYIDGDELNESIQKAVTQEVVSKVMQHVRKSVDDLMNKVLREEISGEMELKISGLMNDFLASDKIKSKFSDDEMTISEWMHKELKGRQFQIINYIEQVASERINEINKK